MKIGQWFVLALSLVSTTAWADLPKTGGEHATVKILIEGHGPTLDQARQNGFSSAIEQVVGQVVVSDKEASGDKLVKDFVGSYSAGYVDDYEVLETHHGDGDWTVKMNVAVASSKIAQRMMASSDKSTVINGQRLQAQLETQLDQRYRGDALLGEVLSSYPQNAFIVNAGESEVKISNNRVPYITVQYQIVMSKFWLESFGEALDAISKDSTDCSSLTVALTNILKASTHVSRKVVQQGSNICGRGPDMRVFYKKLGDWFATAYSYHFQDLQTLNFINSELQPRMGQQHIGLKLDMLDAGGRIVDSRCTNINTELFIRYDNPDPMLANLDNPRWYLRPEILGQSSVYGNLEIALSNIKEVNELARIRMTVERTCT